MTLGKIILLFIIYITVLVIIVEFYYRSNLNKYTWNLGYYHKLDREDIYVTIVLCHIIIIIIFIIIYFIIKSWNVPL